jgi:hypothetical protein
VRVDERLTEVGGSGGDWDWGPAKTVASADIVDLPRIVMKPLSAHLLRHPPLRGAADPRLEGLLFHEGGGPLRRKSVGRAWRSACKAANVPAIRLEWLRHTGASLAYAATGDLKAVARRLRHRDTRMVDRIYVRAYAEAGRETADAIDELGDEAARSVIIREFSGPYSSRDSFDRLIVISTETRSVAGPTVADLGAVRSISDHGPVCGGSAGEEPEVLADLLQVSLFVRQEPGQVDVLDALAGTAGMGGSSHDQRIAPPATSRSCRTRASYFSATLGDSTCMSASVLLSSLVWSRAGQVAEAAEAPALSAMTGLR